MMHQPIKRNSTLRLIQTIANAKKTDSKLKNIDTKLIPQPKEEINYQLIFSKNKLMEVNLQTEDNLRLLDSHPNEALVLACALSELKEEKRVIEHRELLNCHPKQAFDIAKIIMILFKADLLNQSWDRFKENKMNMTESYYIHMILKTLSDKSLLDQYNLDLVFQNAQYATQICSVFHGLENIDQDIFQKTMRFANNAGYIATRLIMSDFTSNEIVGDSNRFQSIIDELVDSEYESKDSQKIMG